MPSRNTAEERAKRAQERAARDAEEAAAQARLAEERENAEKAAAEAKRLEEESEAAAAAAQRSEEEAAAANKRPRTDGMRPADVDLTAEAEAERGEDTNAHIQQINAGGLSDDLMDEDEDVGKDKDPARSPQKKKKRKDKRARDKEEATSILKPSRFTAAATGGKQLQLMEAKKTVAEVRKEEYNNYGHRNPRVVLVCSIKCSQDGVEAKMNEFLMGIRALYKHMLKVDKSVILEPEREGGPRLFDPQGLPTDFTECGAWIKVSGNAGVFEMRKPRKSDEGNRGGEADDELIDPEVYFQCCISCDEEPEVIMERVSFEWARIGGGRLDVKQISSFSTKPAVTLYHVRSNANFSTLVPELRRMLAETRDKAMEEVEDFFGVDVPEFTLQVQMPKITGQNTQQFQGWTWRQQNLRKTIHVIAESDRVKYMQELFSYAKDFGHLTQYLGPNARVVTIADEKKSKRGELAADLSKYDMSAVATYSRNHINYQANTRYDGIRGILDLDKEFSIYSVTNASQVVGRISLRYLLYHHIKSESGFPLFFEVHQGAPMSPVDVVVGDCEESERMVLMINKNPAAFFYFYFTTVEKMDEELVKRIVKSTMDPSFTNEVDQCKWDAEKLLLTTPQDEEAAKVAALEQAAWYKDAFGGNAFDMSKKEQKKQLGAKELEDLHAECSVKTVTKKSGRYEGSPGAETFVVGKKKGTEQAAASAGKEDELDKLSREELLRMLRGAHISPQKGSQPKGRKAGANGSDAGESSFSGESSSGSSSDSHSPLSSVGSKSRAETPARGE
jgi:hypothetical protein